MSESSTSWGGVAEGTARVLMLGFTGYVGRATVKALLESGHHVVCAVRPASWAAAASVLNTLGHATGQCSLRQWNPDVQNSLIDDVVKGDEFDVLVSCMASRTGVTPDAYAVDYQAHSSALKVCNASGIGHFVLLSAICVQKPLLAFQQAKLAFERELIDSGLNYSIVRPTAFFKSLSGQFERVRRGQPFLLFGDGRLTACKPISDGDLGAYIAGCLNDPARHRAILPIGGPGPALTPLEQGHLLFGALGLKPRFRRVPVAMMDAIVTGLDWAGRIHAPWRAKAELARIGRYYATESMLVLDPETGRYSETATPSFGSHTLADHYAAMARGEVVDQRGDHAVF